MALTPGSVLDLMGNGLVARIGPSGKPFDIGASTRPFKYSNIHSHRYHPPPPLPMPAAGRLFLGFKDFEPGNSQGPSRLRLGPLNHDRIVKPLDAATSRRGPRPHCACADERGGTKRADLADAIRD